MMKTFTQLLTFFILLLPIAPAIAQDRITCPQEDKVDTERTPGTPLIIHFVDTPDAVMSYLELESYSGSADFIWARFNEVDKTYTNIKIELGVGASSVSGVDYTPPEPGLKPGGYRVIRDNDATNPRDTLYAWFVIDYLSITAITPANTCDVLGFKVNHTAQIVYSYFDLSVTPEEQIYFSSNPRIAWTTVPENVYDGASSNDAWKNSPIRSSLLATTEIRNPAPLVAATYTATITNDFGNTATAVSTLEIPAIAVYPVMKVEEQKGDGNWVGTTELKGSALYKLRYDHSESKNADTYTWLGYDNYDNIQTRDAFLWTHTTNNLAEKVYVKYSYLGEELDGYLPGQYRDSLIVSNSTTGCRVGIDLTSITPDNPFILVEPSKFDPQSLPNVFSPNGDGVNDVFKFVSGSEPVSMRTMNLRIFDRGGKELYHYSGKLTDWQGWNGKIKGTGSNCPVGVYYYEISGAGWDSIPYSGKPYRGFVHLFKD